MKVELMKDVYYIGVIDWNLRNFHGYSTHRGSTYNAYVVIDDKIAVIDNVKAPFTNQFVENIKEVIGDLKKVDYLISNHLEGDHSGSLPTLAKLCPNAQIVTSEKGKAGFLRMYKEDWDIQAVKEGDTISLGNRTLTFVPVPLIHWPDSMMTYMTPDKILFSNDAFGQHYASSKRVDYENNLIEIMEEAAKYYANIVMHVSTLIKKALEKVTQTLKLEIDMICPSHGIMWKENIGDILGAYTKWSNRETKEKILIIYDTMWHSTEKMAYALLEGIQEEGVEVKIYNLTSTDNSDIMTEVLDARGLLIGSPTLNNGMFPTVAGFLTYLKGLKPPAKLARAFGSYGWNSKKTMEQITTNLKEALIPEILEPITYNFIPDPDELEKCKEFGRDFAKKMKS
ncbi:MAG: FprA family A-type flavoprotein [Candidatus Helarchaeota archaeon]|nr:FprA family A-type flavoprotein [Candidatus Helarchaeota archaeon]